MKQFCGTRKRGEQITLNASICLAVHLIIGFEPRHTDDVLNLKV